MQQMGCNSLPCGSGCCKEENGGGRDDSSSSTEDKEIAHGNHHCDQNRSCLKCKCNEAIVVTAGGRFCADCFRANLFGKFKFAVTSNAMISPTDNVLVAFSGGVSSRVALQFFHEMQVKAQKNFDANRDRSLPVFGVGIAFIDETAIRPVPSQNLEEAVEELKEIVSSLAPPKKRLHIAPIEMVFSSDSAEGNDRAKELVHAVSDVTGKEDLLSYLRMLSLQKIALAYGYNKLVLGSCTSRIACHVIAATVKLGLPPSFQGQGYSLAADIQYVDARWNVPVLLPLRDCLLQELNNLCSLDRLKTVKVCNVPGAGINGLVASFVKLLQKENPSRECTIVRTAGKLTSFQFNKIPEADDCNVHSVSQRRFKKFNMRLSESCPPESFCPICSSPIPKSSVFYESQSSPGDFASRCCDSCQFQILPKETSSMEHFYSLLPQPIIARANDGGSGNGRWVSEFTRGNHVPRR